MAKKIKEFILDGNVEFHEHILTTGHVFQSKDGTLYMHDPAWYCMYPDGTFTLVTDNRTLPEQVRRCIVDIAYGNSALIKTLNDGENETG